MVAYAAQGEPLDAGDVLCTGTLPGCTGLELGRWIRPGQTVELEIDGIGKVANRVVRGVRVPMRSTEGSTEQSS
jgi:2-keto-4-pentenoate hydratase/2-oxohepta-3-ene-1,7-dioic acid hydratase in catechol pathway